MGINQSIDKEQVNRVLKQFEATMAAMKQIEMKVTKMRGYMMSVQSQRENMEKHVKTAASTFDTLGDGLEKRSDEVLAYLTETLENIAVVVEEFEDKVADLNIQDMPREVMREFGPLIVPAVVLVLVITVSNCYFGFLLADDVILSENLFAALTSALSRNSELPLPASAESPKTEGTGELGNSINILRIFAIFHVSLLGAAFLYLFLEGCKGLHLRRRCRRRQLGAESSRRGDEDSEEVSTQDGSAQESPTSSQNRFGLSPKPVSSALRRMYTVTSEISAMRKAQQAESTATSEAQESDIAGEAENAQDAAAFPSVAEDAEAEDGTPAQGGLDMAALAEGDELAVGQDGMLTL